MNNINMLYAIWIVRKFTLFIVIIYEIYILIGKEYIARYATACAVLEYQVSGRTCRLIWSGHHTVTPRPVQCLHIFAYCALNDVLRVHIMIGLIAMRMMWGGGNKAKPNWSGLPPRATIMVKIIRITTMLLQNTTSGGLGAFKFGLALL